MEQGIVVYDDRCGFCQRCVRMLRAWDRGGLHRYEGSSNAALLGELGISEAEAGEELKFAVGGRVFGGYDAVVEAVRQLRLGGLVAVVMRLAPVRWVGRRVYRRVARGRRCGMGVSDDDAATRCG